MIVFKNRVNLQPCLCNGFSLIEVIVALLMTSIAIIGVLGLQTNMLTSTVRSSNTARVTVAIKDVFVDVDKQLMAGSTPKAETIMQLPAGTIKYTRHAATAQTLKNIKNLYHEQVTATWQELGKTVSRTMVRLLYVKPPKKEQSAVGK
jgi:Tfp pilus assembly protein PilV